MLRLAILSILASAACTTHSTNLTDCGATFHGGRLNGAPVKVDQVTAAGIAFRVEHSTFVYEIEQPFQALQQVLSVTTADAKIVWHPTSEDAREFLEGMVTAYRQEVSGMGQLQCEEPQQDGAAWRQECTIPGKVAYHARWRAMPSARGVIAQHATWVSGRGKEWVDAFWLSFHPIAAGGGSAAKSAIAPSIAELATRVSSVASL